MNRKLLSALLFTATTAAVADSVIIQETKTWKSVPVTIDQTAHTYTTVEGPVPTGDYYYSYPGYRCITVKKPLLVKWYIIMPLEIVFIVILNKSGIDMMSASRLQ